MKNQMIKKTLLSSISAMAVMGVSGPSAMAYAEDAAESGYVLEEVTVTARRRSESLQSVPIAVTAFSGENLDKIGATDITFLAQSTPNTTLKVSRGTNTTITAYIRGVGQQDPVAGFSSGVGLYLDDVYLNRPQGAVLEVYDVERIEVLRGPQGTLYGRGSIGGAIKYVTKRMGDETELRLKASGGTYGQMDILASASVPVAEGLAIGGSVAYFSRDGFGTNLNNGKNHYDKDIFAARLSAEFTVAEDFFLKLSGDYTKDTSNEKSGHRVQTSLNTNAPVLDNVFDTRAGITGNQEVIQKGVSAMAEWGVNDTITFKSITAYREDETETPIDFDSLPANDFDVPAIYLNDQFSQEFQVLYEEEKIQGVFGFYYLDANSSHSFDVILGGLVPPLGFTAYTFGDVNVKSWAVFGDASYDVSDTFSVGVGARYTKDKTKAKVFRQSYLGMGSPALGNDSAIPFGAPAADFDESRTDDKLTAKVSLKWQPSDDMNLYAAFAQGFKSGGFDPRGSNLAKDGFEPEQADSFEIGMKSVFADGRIRTNIAAFFSDYKDIQIPGSVAIDLDGDGTNDSFVGTVTNAGKAEIWGLEFEGTAMVTDSLTAALNLGYTNADYKEWLVEGVNIADTKHFQNTPEWNGQFSLNYEQSLSLFGDEGTFNIIGALSFVSKTYVFEDPIPLLDQDGYALVDLSLVWTSEDGGIQVGIHGKNLGDKEYKVAGYNFPTLGLEGSVTSFYGNPMTVTGTVDFRF